MTNEEKVELLGQMTISIRAGRGDYAMALLDKALEAERDRARKAPEEERDEKSKT